jgi:hypothetical protein
VVGDDETDGYVMVRVSSLKGSASVTVKVVDEYSVYVLHVPQTLAGQTLKSLDEGMEAVGVSVKMSMCCHTSKGVGSVITRSVFSKDMTVLLL